MDDVGSFFYAPRTIFQIKLAHIVVIIKNIFLSFVTTVGGAKQKCLAENRLPNLIRVNTGVGKRKVPLDFFLTTYRLQRKIL